MENRYAITKKSGTINEKTHLDTLILALSKEDFCYTYKMKLASIDVGLKRIGVAICLDGSIVIPQNAILRKNRNQAARDLNTFLKEWEIEKLIVGLPKDANNSEEMQRRIEHFVSLLKLTIDLDYQDEQHSSLEARELTKGVFKHKKDGRIDSIAAKIILERYLSLPN